MRRRFNRYSSDRPIHSEAEDLLNRSKFARQIARDIHSWKGHDSLVIGLYGGWGSGKTSVKNLVLSQFGKRRWRMPFVDFNPWQFSGRNITAAFFAELGAALGKSDSSADSKQRAKRLQKYGARLALGGTTLEKVGVTLGLLGVPFSEYVRTAGKAVGSIAKVTKEGADAERAEANEPPLSQLKRELSDLLADLDDPILIVIDDIDRLTTNEIREVFQLIKANADFPNLIYLLLFERRIVSDALNQISGNRGYEFLEKIVQVGYHVPYASPDAVHRILFSGLDASLKLPGVDQKWEPSRWRDVFQDGLANYFTNLRDVYRFLTSFSFHVEQFRSKKEFEVNPVDLIGLEVLRVFDPDVYDRLATSKNILTRDPGNGRLGETKQAVVNAGVEQILDILPRDRRDIVKSILEVIFPPITTRFGGREGLSSVKQEWLRKGRVCHSDFFEKYFTLVVPATDLSQAELERLINSAGDRQAFLNQFRALRSRGLLRITLERADAYKSEIRLESIPALIRSLCELSDELPPPEPGSGFFFFDPSMILWRLIYFSLRREKDPSKRLEILRDALSDSDAILLPLDIVSSEQRSKEKDDQAFEYLIDESELAALVTLVLGNVRRWANDGRLRKHPRADEVLFRWGALVPLKRCVNG